MQEHAYVLNIGVGHGPECTGLEKKTWPWAISCTSRQVLEHQQSSRDHPVVNYCDNLEGFNISTLLKYLSKAQVV